MYQDHTVGVVIPAYNEAGFVGDVIETVPDYVDRIYPVDDCSTDGTWAEICEAATRIDGAPPAVSADGGTCPTGTGPATGDEANPSANGASGTDGSDPDVDDLPDDPDFSPAGDSPSAEGASIVAETAPPEPEPGDGPGPGSATDADRTADTSSDDAGVRRRVVPTRHAENRGVGGAIKTGYQRARTDRIDVTVVMGGDGQMDPAWMPDLLDPIVDGRAEYAKANRLLLPEHHETMPRHRFVGNHLLTELTKIATGYWSVGDPQHGYTAISLAALDTAGIDELYEFFGYCNDLLIRLSAENLRVADVPCPLTYADEESHIAYSEYVPRVSGMLLRSFLRRLWVDRSSSGGRGRLALFLGGAIATVAGLVGVVASGFSPGSAGDEPPAMDDPESADAESDRREDEGETEDADSDGEAIEQRAAGRESEPPARTGRSTCRPAAVALAGVAALLGAMLLDAVMNSAHNYTERLPEGSGPRTDETDE